MFVSMSAFFLNLLGCSDPPAAISDGSEWYHTPPDRAAQGLHPLKLRTVRWTFDPDKAHIDPTAMRRAIQESAPLWHKPLGCGVELMEVKITDTPDIVFRCEPSDGFGHNGYLEVAFVKGLEEKNQTIVRIDPKLCKRANRSLALNVVGHGLGFEEGPNVRLFPSIMDLGTINWDQNSGDQARYYDSINGQELDALRIWALEQGAPGCGADDPLWSWEDPNLGYTYSAGPSPEMLHYIQELEARAKN